MHGAVDASSAGWRGLRNLLNAVVACGAAIRSVRLLLGTPVSDRCAQDSWVCMVICRGMAEILPAAHAPTSVRTKLPIRYFALRNSNASAAFSAMPAAMAFSSSRYRLEWGGGDCSRSMGRVPSETIAPGTRSST